MLGFSVGCFGEWIALERRKSRMLSSQALLSATGSGIIDEDEDQMIIQVMSDKKVHIT